jgi:hypothetical protein
MVGFEDSVAKEDFSCALSDDFLSAQLGRGGGTRSRGWGSILQKEKGHCSMSIVEQDFICILEYNVLEIGLGYSDYDSLTNEILQNMPGWCNKAFNKHNAR